MYAMKRTHLVAAAVAMLIMTAMPIGSSAFHGDGQCKKNNIPDLTDPVTVDTVMEDQINSYKLVVPAGQTAYVTVQPINGDVDIEVCSATGPEHDCSGHNPFPTFDGCHVPELAVPCPICIGGSTQYGLPLGPGSYRVDIHNCFSPHVDGCDYTLGAGGGGELDVYFDTVPVAYILNYVLN